MSRMKVVDPALKWFWKKCRAKLAWPINQRKSSWHELTLAHCMRRLREETTELAYEVRELRHDDNKWNRQAVIEEAVDVANFAMMIADKARSPKGEKP